MAISFCGLQSSQNMLWLGPWVHNQNSEGTSKEGFESKAKTQDECNIFSHENVSIWESRKGIPRILKWILTLGVMTPWEF